MPDTEPESPGFEINRIQVATTRELVILSVNRANGTQNDPQPEFTAGDLFRILPQEDGDEDLPAWFQFLILQVYSNNPAGPDARLSRQELESHLDRNPKADQLCRDGVIRESVLRTHALLGRAFGGTPASLEKEFREFSRKVSRRILDFLESEEPRKKSPKQKQ